MYFFLGLYDLGQHKAKIKRKAYKIFLFAIYLFLSLSFYSISLVYSYWNVYYIMDYILLNIIAIADFSIFFFLHYWEHQRFFKIIQYLQKEKTRTTVLKMWFKVFSCQNIRKLRRKLEGYERNNHKIIKVGSIIRKTRTNINTAKGDSPLYWYYHAWPKWLPAKSKPVLPFMQKNEIMECHCVISARNMCMTSVRDLQNKTKSNVSFALSAWNPIAKVYLKKMSVVIFSL